MLTLLFALCRSVLYEVHIKQLEAQLHGLSSQRLYNGY